MNNLQERERIENYHEEACKAIQAAMEALKESGFNSDDAELIVSDGKEIFLTLGEGFPTTAIHPLLQKIKKREKAEWLEKIQRAISSVGLFGKSSSFILAVLQDLEKLINEDQIEQAELLSTLILLLHPDGENL